MAGFLGMNKKVAGGAAKPTAPVKPAIKPIAKAPVSPVAKPAVKPVTTPSAPKLGGIKPVVKPVVKPPVKEEVKKEVTEVVETIETAPVADTTEEKVTLAPVEVEETTIEETTEAAEDSTTEKVDAEIETVETVVEEESKSDDIPEGYTEEEWAAMSPQKRGAITRKKNQENKKRKQALEDHKEEVAKDLAASVPAYTPEPIPSRSEVQYEEVLSTMIISSAGAEWDKQVAELTATLKGIAIEPDMNTATMKHAMADLVGLKDTIFSEYTLSKTILEATERKIDMVKGLNAKGSSADERKLNSLRACVAYEQDGITINLYELLDVATAKFNFYNELMKQIEFKAKSLITMNGALKLEKDALGQL